MCRKHWARTLLRYHVGFCYFCILGAYGILNLTTMQHLTAQLAYELTDIRNCIPLYARITCEQRYYIILQLDVAKFAITIRCVHDRTCINSLQMLTSLLQQYLKDNSKIYISRDLTRLFDIEIFPPVRDFLHWGEHFK